MRTVRDELRQNLTDLTNPSSTARQTIPEPEPDPDVGLEEEELWLDLPDTAEQAANSVAGVPQPVPGSSSASSGAASGSGSVHEPSALRTDSAPAASSAAPASTQPFSGRVLNAYSGDELVYSKTLGDWRTHNGVDYACAEGSAVSAPCSGKVTETGTDGRWSSVVTLEDASGRLWRVCGVNSPAVKPGDTVTAGQKLGTVGTISCECAEEAHIHLEVLQNGQYLDPAKSPERKMPRCTFPQRGILHPFPNLFMVSPRCPFRPLPSASGLPPEIPDWHPAQSTQGLPTRPF